MNEGAGGLDDDELLRYSRHILLDELGIEAQQRFVDAHVLIVGMGGLGTPAALYLAASGVGHITLADADHVDLTNLQRQILYRTSDVGAAKVAAARDALARVNPRVSVQARQERLAGQALREAVGQADVILDCTDNFATRHAINRACVASHRPLVSGAAVGFDGQVSVFDLTRAESPCYHCLFPEDGETDAVNCATMGVFAPLTGVVGTLQAGEALKLIGGIGESLCGRLILFDAKGSRWQSIRIERDAQCPVCSLR
jgi:molybdopterin/thiamine biosynthesis adenylyltransferase